MKRMYFATFLALSIALAFNNIVLGAEPPRILGNGIGEVPLAKGPASLHVDMGECQFDMSIRQGEYVKYNGPDVILYQAKSVLASRDLPRLRQSEMPVGYDWWFEEHAKISHPWIGLMCAGKEDFSWSSRTTGDQVSPELRQIFDVNSLKCPADFDGKKWVRKTSKSGIHFIGLGVNGAVGFVVDDANGKKSDEPKRFQILLCQW